MPIKGERMMLDQKQIDDIIKEIEDADGDVQFISMSSPEQSVEKSFPEWIWECIVKFIWLR